MTEKLNWYAIRTQNNKERSVLQKLNLEMIRSGLTESIGRTLVLTEKVYSVKNGKKIAREKVVYPGYLFIETNAVGEISNILKSINGAAGFVKTKSGEITPLKDSEVSMMIIDQESKDLTEGLHFSVGESVKVTSGSFATFRGKINSVDHEKNKVKVEIMIFSRPTIVELNYLEIERTQ